MALSSICRATAEGLAADIASACVQAEAALTAAQIQADAAYAVGWMTLVAAALAVLGTGAAAHYGYRGINRQIASAKQLQIDAQTHAVKRDVYLDAATVAATGMLAIVRFSDLRVSSSDVLTAYHSDAPKLSKVQVVAPLNVYEKVLSAASKLGEVHMALTVERLVFENKPDDQRNQAQWAAHCLSKLPEVVPTFTDAVVAIRDDLKMPIDHVRLKAIILSSIVRSGDKSREALKAIEAVFKEEHPLQ